MSSQDDVLNEINQRLQSISENSYLTRLDLMFSMLLSLTIFLLGITINHPLPKIVSAPLVGLLIIFIFTLIGLIHAIIRDDIVDRFKYWIALLFNFLMFIPYSGYWIAIILLPSRFLVILALLVSFYGVFLMLFLVVAINYFSDLFDNFLKKFPIRGKEIKYPSEKTRSLFIPTVVEYLMMVASFAIMYIILTF